MTDDGAKGPLDFVQVLNEELVLVGVRRQRIRAMAPPPPQPTDAASDACTSTSTAAKERPQPPQSTDGASDRPAHPEGPPAPSPAAGPGREDVQTGDNPANGPRTTEAGGGKR